MRCPDILACSLHSVQLTFFPSLYMFSDPLCGRGAYTCCSEKVVAAMRHHMVGFSCILAVCVTVRLHLRVSI